MTERHLPRWKVLANIGEGSCTIAGVARTKGPAMCYCSRAGILRTVMNWGWCAEIMLNLLSAAACAEVRFKRPLALHCAAPA